MAKVKISDFSSTPGNNTEIDNINISEGCAPSGINDAIRELMAQLKDFQTGAAGDSFNGPVGTTTAAAGAFTTLTASSTATLNTLASSGATLTGGTINGMAIGGTTAAAVSATTLTTSSTVTLNGGTANGVAYLNGSKVLTTGSALTFDGTSLGVSQTTASGLKITGFNSSYGASTQYFNGGATTNGFTVGQGYATGTDNTAFLLNAANAPIVFGVNATEQMRLTSTGLGIGTSSPAAKLHANSGSAARSALFQSTTTAAGIEFLDSTTTINPGIFGIGNSTTFWNNSAERMRLDSSGNLGLGVTPSAWSGAFNPVFQNKAGTLAGSGPTNFRMFANTYYDGSSYRYINNGGATQYEQDGYHAWFTAPSGTAGNAISFTQAMTLDASGRLGIGTTSPNSTLSVNGNILAPWANSGTYEIGVEQRTTNVFSTTTNVFVVRGADAVFGNDAMGGGSVLIRGGKGYGTAGGPAGDVVIQGGEALSGYVANPGNIIFKTGQTTAERARIDSSGNLLVGTTSDGFSGRVAAYGSGAYVAYSANNLTNTNFSIRLGGSAGNVALRALPGTGQGSISFEVGNAGDERARIDSSGNLLVGKTSGTCRLDVEAAFTGTQAVARFGNTTASGAVGCVDTSLESNGNSTSSYHLRSVTQNVNIWYLYGNGTSSFTSDQRLKKNIAAARDGYLEDLMQLRVVKYHWKNNDDASPKELGLIAQEVEQVFPGLVQEADVEFDGVTPKVLKGSVLPFMLLKAIQEQQAIIEDMKTRLAAAGI